MRKCLDKTCVTVARREEGYRSNLKSLAGSASKEELGVVYFLSASVFEDERNERGLMSE